MCEDLETAARRDLRAPDADRDFVRVARCYEKSGRLGPAVLMYRLLVRHFPRSPRAPLAMLRMAQSFERLTYYQNAAKWYETLAGKHPRSRHASAALLKGLELRAALQDEPEALAHAALFARLYGARQKRQSAQAWWVVVQMHERMGVESKLLTSLDRYLRRYGRVGAADRRLWAASRLATIWWRRSCKVAPTGALCVRYRYRYVGKGFVKKIDGSKPPRALLLARDASAVRKARRYSRMASTLWAKGALLKRIPQAAAERAQRFARARRAAARAAFVALDSTAEAHLWAKLPGGLDFQPRRPGRRRASLKRLQAWLARRVLAIEKLIRGYEGVVKGTRRQTGGKTLPEADSAIAAASRAGALYYLLAQRLRGLAPPWRLRRPPARRAFRGQLHRAAIPLLAKALARSEACLKLAVRHHWWSDWAKRCRSRATAMAPARFPVLREVRPRLGRHVRPTAPVITPKRVGAFLARPGHVGENERLARGFLAMGRGKSVPPRLMAFWKKRLHRVVGSFEAAEAHLRTILSVRSVATKPTEIADELRAWVLLTRLYQEWARRPPHRSKRLLAELAVQQAQGVVTRRLKGRSHCRAPGKPAAVDRALAALHNVRGRLLAHEWRFGEAAEQFRAALRCDASFRDALMNRAALAVRLGNYRLAQASYLTALKLGPGDPDALIGLGVTARCLGTASPAGKGSRIKPAQWFGVAARRYRAVLRQRANHPGALFNLGILLMDHLRQPAAGKKVLTRFLRQLLPLTFYEEQRYARRKLGIPPPRPPKEKKLRPPPRP